MVAPLIAGMLATLAQNGLGMLAGAIQAKGKEVIEDKLGIKIPNDASQLTPELIAELKIREMEHEEFLISAQIEKAEIDLEEMKAANTNTADARKMNADIQTSDKAAYIAKVAAYYLDFIIVVSTMGLGAALIFVDISKTNENLAFTIFGSLVTMSMTVLNFHRGTSASSKKKDDAIHEVLTR